MTSYSDSTSKINSRNTIISLYREIFKTDSLPIYKQYVTMCNEQYDINGFSSTSELGQMLSSGLLQVSNQFIGVDLKQEFIDENKRVCPEGSIFICDDIIVALHDLAEQSWYDPGIVHIDTEVMPKKAIPMLASAMYYVSKYSNVMVVLNTVTNNLRNNMRINIDDQLFKLLHNEFDFKRADKVGNWKYLNSYFPYGGKSDNAEDRMTSLVFVNNNH